MVVYPHKVPFRARAVKTKHTRPRRGIGLCRGDRMAGETERRKAQNIILENRSRLSVSGVEEVSGFDESIVQMQTELGALTVHGSNLRVETLSVDSGDLLVVGDISDLSYADVPVRRGFWARLFG